MTPLTKPQKILAVLYELSVGQARSVSYEQIVVRAFEKYPTDFQLRGYPQYPDSSDIHKPLYSMKKQGLVRSANKSFELTPKGIEIAARLGSKATKPTARRLTKSEEFEISRVLSSDGFHLFSDARAESILDTDFYEYLGVSVRTPRNDFLGKLHTVAQAVESYAQNIGGPFADTLKKYHHFMVEKFAPEISSRR
jgi:hypothetical protein